MVIVVMSLSRRWVGDISITVQVCFVSFRGPLRLASTELKVETFNTTPGTHVLDRVDRKIALSEWPFPRAISRALVVLAAVVDPHTVRNSDRALLVASKDVRDHFAIVGRFSGACLTTELAFWPHG